MHPLYALTDNGPDGRIPIVEQLKKLETPEEFWLWVAQHVPAAEIARRKAYYAAYFERERIAPYHQLYALCDDFFNDILASPSPAAPFTSKADLDEALAAVTRFREWPHDAIPTPADYFEIYSELAGFGIIPAGEALDRLKSAIRTEYSVAYNLPVFAALRLN